ncbi:MAG: FAD-dependent oxidoreductase, partial [Kiloniellales bacterium]|nr:FAD-dependent oxidoreductase [Kiloniellales bacterium]
MPIVIAGAGLIGAAIAYHLARDGHDVLVLERSGIAAEASSKSFGWINSSIGNSNVYARLRQDSIAAYRSLDAALANRLPLKWGGGLWWHEDESLLERSYLELKAQGYPVRWLARDDIKALEPNLASVPERALLAENEGSLDCEAAVHLLLDAAREMGAELHLNTEVREFSRKGRKLVIETGAGQILADRLVLATGAASEALAARHGVSLPLKNLPGFLARTKPLKPVLNRVLLSPRL